MKERPILMSGEMVRAILEDRKSETRRVVNPQPYVVNCDVFIGERVMGQEEHVFFGGQRCPYGQSGDRLWVRETWGEPWHYAQPCVFYRATEKSVDSHPDFDGWKPSIFMPRRLSRITLEIADIRVERVQDITDYGAKAEGTWLEHRDHVLLPPQGRLRAKFSTLWDTLNAKRGYSWASNPWVWVIKFKVLDKEGLIGGDLVPTAELIRTRDALLKAAV